MAIAKYRVANKKVMLLTNHAQPCIYDQIIYWITTKRQSTAGISISVKHINHLFLVYICVALVFHMNL